MSNNYVGLMAKYPEPGKVKTRLARSIGNEKAVAVYSELLHRCIKNCSDCNEAYTIVPFVSPSNLLDSFTSRFSSFKICYPQQGDSLGEKMLNAVLTLQKNHDAERIILIGADIPELNKTIIKTAFQLLEESDIVLGPTTDGGYYLIGMKDVCKKLFYNVEFGTDTVLATSIGHLQKSKLHYTLLSKLSDLDTVEDIKKFPDFSKYLQ